MKSQILSGLGVLLLVGAFIGVLQLASIADEQRDWCERLGGVLTMEEGASAVECVGDYTDFIDVIRK